MLTFLTLTFLCSPAPQDPIHHEMQIHEISGLIDFEQELGQSMMERMAIEFAAMALAEQVESGTSEDPLSASLGSFALQQVAASQKQQQDEIQLLAALGYVDSLEETAFPFASASDLLENVTLYMQPPFDPQVQELKTEVVGDTRVLMGYLMPEQHAWLSHFLDLQRHGAGTQVLMETVLVTASAKQFPWDGGTALIMNETESTDELMKEFLATGADILSSPRVIALLGQEAVVSVLSQISFISDWSLETVQPGDRQVADPKIEVLPSGIELMSRVHVVEEGHLGLTLTLQASRVEEEIPTETIELGGQAFEISRPELTTREIETSLIVPDGGSIVLRAPGFEEDEQLFLIMKVAMIQ